jgi:hypothetical protein
VTRIRAGLAVGGLVAAMGATAAVGGWLLIDAVDDVELPRRCQPGDSCAPLLHADDFAAGRADIEPFRFPEHEGEVHLGYRVVSHVGQDRAVAVEDLLVVDGAGDPLVCSDLVARWLHVPAGGDAVAVACRAPDGGGALEVRYEGEVVAVDRA